jgi:hypothetical protein
VSRSCACIGSPCLRHCGHGASIGGGRGVGPAPPTTAKPRLRWHPASARRIARSSRSAEDRGEDDRDTSMRLAGSSRPSSASERLASSPRSFHGSRVAGGFGRLEARKLVSFQVGGCRACACSCALGGRWGGGGVQGRDAQLVRVRRSRRWPDERLTPSIGERGAPPPLN